MSLLAAIALATGLAAAPPPPRPAPSGQVSRRERVVVLGWRIIDNAFRTRQEAYAAGMRAVGGRTECAEEDCGFLLVHEENRWFLTNVATLSFDDLMELRRDVADSDTVVVFRQAPAPETPRFAVSTSGPPSEMVLP